MKTLATSCLVMLTLVSLTSAQQAKEIAATEILDRVATVYSSCHTYSDEGQASIDAGRGAQIVASFTTTFVRPSRFRLDFSFERHKKPVQRYVAWKNGDVEQLWSPASLSPTSQALALSLASLPGLASESGQAIPRLLLGDLFRDGSANVLNSLADLKLSRGEVIDGHATYRIDGKSMGQEVRLWIDQTRFLVLRIQRTEEQTLSGLVLKASRVISYQPQVNIEVPAEQLAFNPPLPRMPPPATGPSNVEIVKFGWSRKILSHEILPPLPRSQTSPSAAPAPEGSSPFPPSGKLPVAYFYSLKIKNAGTKAITGVAWDYVAIDPATRKELARHHFVSPTRVRVGNTETLTGRLPSPPQKVIGSVAVAKGDSLSGEQVDIICVSYADGSWWQNPAASGRPCEIFGRAGGPRPR